MKILVLCNIMIPQIAEKLSQKAFYGGGWITGLINSLSSFDEFDLVVCFPINFNKNLIEGNLDNLSYYGFPIENKNSLKYNKNLEKQFISILYKEKPDVVHIFGTEYPHTLSMVIACERCNIVDRVIINIQGLVSIYAKHYYASLPFSIINGFTIRDIIKRDNIKLNQNKFKKQGIYEINAIMKVSHVVGRTDWDKSCTKMINPNINYHFCNEILRDSFYNKKWSLEKCERHSIFISQCNYPIKGFHYMLEAMSIIVRKYPDAHLYATGRNLIKSDNYIEKLKRTNYFRYIGKLIKKLKLEKHITFLGVLDEKQMCDSFLKAHVFVSPSTVENESNSLSEAKILGVPSIASYVGGVTNRLEHGNDGFFYQHDAPYMLAYYIGLIFNDDNLALKISSNARKNAQLVNDKNTNLNTMIKIYKEIGE